MNQRILQAMAVLLACLGAHAQVNSGSNGSDGAFNPTTNIVIKMADHPTGIYHYTSVNVPSGVTVTFIPNANNTPVYWLVQNDCVINGTVDIHGQMPTGGGNFPNCPCLTVGGRGGPGGWRGGNGWPNPSPGEGLGGGTVPAGGGSYGTAGIGFWGTGTGGPVYGNANLIPIVGGSGGGGGGGYGAGGGGGGGAVLIAADTIQLNGVIDASGTPGFYSGGLGRVRIEASENSFGGTITGVLTHGFPIALHGRVTDTGGAPLNGAVISVAFGNLPLADTSADANGFYAIPLGTGVYALTASASGYAKPSRVLTFNAGTAPQNFQLADQSRFFRLRAR